jgi:hypothetical protein
VYVQELVEAVDDAARLLARAAVGLLDRDGLARFCFPVSGERRVELLIEFVTS